jgi:hypothetical protein
VNGPRRAGAAVPALVSSQPQAHKHSRPWRPLEPPFRVAACFPVRATAGSISHPYISYPSLAEHSSFLPHSSQSSSSSPIFDLRSSIRCTHPTNNTIINSNPPTTTNSNSKLFLKFQIQTIKMRASFAVIAAVAGIASAAPQYGYGYPTPEE